MFQKIIKLQEKLQQIALKNLSNLGWEGMHSGKNPLEPLKLHKIVQNNPLWDGGKKYCPSNGLPTAVNKGQLFWNAK